MRIFQRKQSFVEEDVMAVGESFFVQQPGKIIVMTLLGAKEHSPFGGATKLSKSSFFPKVHVGHAAKDPKMVVFRFHSAPKLIGL